MQHVRLLLSGLAGGALVAALLLVTGLGDDERTTTVVRQAPISAGTATATGSGGEPDGRAVTPADIYRRDAPGVVFIRAQVVEDDASPLDAFPSQRRGEATGSGFVIDRRGSIITNAHVVEGAVKVTVQFSDDETVEARVVGRDTSNDLALLRVDPDGLELRPLALGSAKDVEVGDPAIAIGNPFGLSRTLTTGVISAKQRRIQAPNGFTIDDVLQTDAPINPGNSGGPLLDAAGRVIGVNSQIETGGGTSGGNVGIGFAVPIDTARKVLPQLEEGGEVERPWLGVTSLTVDGSLEALDLDVDRGALVQSVQQGSPAARAGLQGGDVTAQLPNGDTVQVGGDVIVRIDGEDVRTADDLGAALEDERPGDEITVRVARDGAERDVELRLGERPTELQGSG